MGAMDDPTARQPTPTARSTPGSRPRPTRRRHRASSRRPTRRGATPPASPPPASTAAPRRRHGAAGRGRAATVELGRATPHATHDGRWAGTFFGLLLLGLGLWFFAEKTLGLDMPDIRWSQFWPVILIVIGVVILFSALRRERR